MPNWTVISIHLLSAMTLDLAAHLNQICSFFQHPEFGSVDRTLFEAAYGVTISLSYLRVLRLLCGRVKSIVEAESSQLFEVLVGILDPELSEEAVLEVLKLIEQMAESQGVEAG
jgi:hypothetical protein